MAPAHSLPLRRRPDARVLSPWPASTIAKLVRYVSWLIYPLLPLYALRWIFNPRGQSLRVYLGTRLAVWTSHLVPLFPEPESDKKAASLCPPAERYAAFEEGVWDGARWDVTTVPTAPVDMCSHLAARPECVAPVKRPAFMISPAGAKGQAFEKAKEGEKIILFIHGG